MQKITHTLSKLLLLLAMFAGMNDTSARKKGYRLDYNKKEAVSDREEAEMAKGSFMVASQCTDCNNGYKLEQISFTGYDKPRQSSVETFFITNNTDRTLTGINLYIDYRMTDGRQLTKRFFRLSCSVPPGETRMAEIPSWDKQHSFVYEKSASTGKRPATPYTVVFDPVAYFLSY